MKAREVGSAPVRQGWRIRERVSEKGERKTNEKEGRKVGCLCLWKKVENVGGRVNGRKKRVFR